MGAILGRRSTGIIQVSLAAKQRRRLTRLDVTWQLEDDRVHSFSDMYGCGQRPAGVRGCVDPSFALTM